MFLKSNMPLTRVLKHARDTGRRVPVKHLYASGVRPPLRDMENAGLINIYQDSQHGHTVNLSAKGYKEAISILGGTRAG
jgi:hypothetical protein